MQSCDASVTWQAIEPELVPVEVRGERRFTFAARIDALKDAEPLTGVRLVPMNDPDTTRPRSLIRSCSSPTRPSAPSRSR